MVEKMYFSHRAHHNISDHMSLITARTTSKKLSVTWLFSLWKKKDDTINTERNE